LDATALAMLAIVLVAVEEIHEPEHEVGSAAAAALSIEI
jgi:hypothetical protein